MGIAPQPASQQSLIITWTLYYCYLSILARFLRCSVANTYNLIRTDIDGQFSAAAGRAKNDGGWIGTTSLRHPPTTSRLRAMDDLLIYYWNMTKFNCGTWWMVPGWGVQQDTTTHCNYRHIQFTFSPSVVFVLVVDAAAMVGGRGRFYYSLIILSLYVAAVAAKIGTKWRP